MRRLLPFLDVRAVALTGGVAIRLHAQANGDPEAPRPLADLDLVAPNLFAVSPEVSRAFLVTFSP